MSLWQTATDKYLLLWPSGENNIQLFSNEIYMWWESAASIKFNFAHRFSLWHFAFIYSVYLDRSQFRNWHWEKDAIAPLPLDQSCIE